jgi:membrane fusion protein, multidrug efflux system
VLADSSFDRLQDKSKIVVSRTPIPANTSGSSAP